MFMTNTSNEPIECEWLYNNENPVVFSVVVPVYNVIGCLPCCRDALDAACKRYDGQIEVIWIDDGSTDGSSELLDSLSFSASNVRSKVLHQPNRGVSAARNVGIDVAEGTWHMFLDPDDIYHPEVFNRCDKILKTSGADVLKFGYRKMDRIESEWPLPKDDDVRVFEMAEETDFVRVTKEHLAVLRMWNGCFHRSIVEQVRFRDTPNGEDGLFAQEILGVAKRVAITNTPLHLYLQRPGSAVHTVSLKMANGHVHYNRLRYDVRIGWRYFNSVLPALRRDMRNSVGGATMGLIMGLRGAEKEEAKKFFWSDLRNVFCSGRLYSGGERLLYCFTFACESWLLALLVIRMPWWIRKEILRFSVARRVLSRLRKESKNDII